jgi:hypothetical protein
MTITPSRPPDDDRQPAPPISIRGLLLKDINKGKPQLNPALHNCKVLKNDLMIATFSNLRCAVLHAKHLLKECPNQNRREQLREELSISGSDGKIHYYPDFLKL